MEDQELATTISASSVYNSDSELDVKLGPMFEPVSDKFCSEVSRLLSNTVQSRPHRVPNSPMCHGRRCETSALQGQQCLLDWHWKSRPSLASCAIRSSQIIIHIFISTKRRKSAIQHHQSTCEKSTRASSTSHHVCCSIFCISFRARVYSACPASHTRPPLVLILSSG